VSHDPSSEFRVIDLPLPPLEFRHLVGPTDPAEFDAASVVAQLEQLPPDLFASVFDFGCGCGRLARQLMLNGRMPLHYLGVDPHKGMIAWCRDNISARVPQFQFRHHDVFQEFMNPGGTLEAVPLAAGDGSVTLFLAWSVFTHLLQPDAEYYLRELARVLAPNGVAVTTWFQFDKRDFPMMQEFQNALYISDFDPTNAVIFDRRWLEAAIANAGLTIASRTQPSVHGHQWAMHLRRA
jgi:SAM-dependent methyltransferase